MGLAVVFTVGAPVEGLALVGVALGAPGVTVGPVIVGATVPDAVGPDPPMAGAVAVALVGAAVVALVGALDAERPRNPRLFGPT